MGHRETSKGVAVITVVWLLASAAALALATTSGDAVAQQGCRGGGSPSPSGSPSSSPSGGSTFPPIPSILPYEERGSRLPEQAAVDAARDPIESDPRRQEVPVVVAQAITCKSTITIAYESGRNPKFTGKVGSGEPMCKRARDVTVKKVKRGADLTVGKAVTNAKGVYNVPARNANGRFYSKVSKSTTENDDGERVTCQAARSKAIRP